MGCINYITRESSGNPLKDCKCLKSEPYSLIYDSKIDEETGWGLTNNK